MSIIRIITSTVKDIGKKIERSATRVNEIGKRVGSSGSAARTYDNNTFGPEVRAICNEGNARALNISVIINILAARLDQKVNAFLIADGTFFSNFWSWVKNKFGKEESVFAKYLNGDGKGEEESAFAKYLDDDGNVEKKSITDDSLLIQSEQNRKIKYSKDELITKIKEENERLPTLPKYESTDMYGPSHDQCVPWARERRFSLGGEDLPPSSIGKDLSADNYIKIYSSSVEKINNINADSILAKTEAGAALVIKGTNKNRDGHVAIVEVVQQDGIWISEANWGWVQGVFRGKSPVRFIKNENLINLFVIPKDANPD